MRRTNASIGLLSALATTSASAWYNVSRQNGFAENWLGVVHERHPAMERDRMSAVQTEIRKLRPCISAPDSPPKRCDLCEGSRFNHIGRRDRRGNELHTAICLQCGLVCHLNIPNDSELEEFYANDYRRQYHGETTPSARRVMRAWNNAQRIYRQLAPFVHREDAIFEVGAGIGCNVKAFELNGFDATGIEPGAGFWKFSTCQMKTRLTKTGLFDIIAEPRYDLILLVHVIEHFNSPRRSLERIRDLLKPGGALYVECPNLTAPFARPGKMFHFAHVHNFTPNSLQMMAQRCGFEVERTFSTAENPNLQMLWRRREEAAPLKLDRENLSRTLSALEQYNIFTYHLRWRYLKDRVQKLAGYLGEHLFARRKLRRLTALCQRRNPATPTSHAVRR